VTQPAFGFDYGRLLTEMLGSFWSAVYQDQTFLKTYMDGFTSSMGQAYFDFFEKILTTSINDIHIFHRDRWKLLTFLESELNRNTATVLKYGGSPAFSNGPFVLQEQSTLKVLSSSSEAMLRAATTPLHCLRLL